jgi:hypothetical protein
MKYIILSFGTQRDYDAMSGQSTDHPDLKPEDFAPMYEFMTSFNDELERSGELVDTRGLVAPVHTRRVQLKEGVPVVTDGPYAETQEVLAGYWIVDCETPQHAYEIAARASAAPGRGGKPLNMPIEVREVMSAPPVEV